MPKEGLNDAKTNIIKDAWDRFHYEQALASERGASSWLNVMPLMKYIFKLNKEEFRCVTVGIQLGTREIFSMDMWGRNRRLNAQSGIHSHATQRNPDFLVRC